MVEKHQTVVPKELDSEQSRAIIESAGPPSNAVTGRQAYGHSIVYASQVFRYRRKRYERDEATARSRGDDVPAGASRNPDAENSKGADVAARSLGRATGPIAAWNRHLRGKVSNQGECEKQMQFQIRINDRNYLTLDVELQAASSDTPDDIPEVVKATVLDAKLSDVREDQLLSVVGQAIDALYAVPEPAPNRDLLWGDDERAAFRVFNPNGSGD